MSKLANIKLIWTGLLAIILLFFVLAGSVLAANTYLTGENVTSTDGSNTLKVDFFLNTKEEKLNAFEGKITFPQDVLGFESISTENSILNFWIRNPALNRENSIIFAGATPWGFIEADGLVFSIIFKVKGATENGKSDIISAAELKAYLNDGLGTEIDIFPYQVEFNASESGIMFFPQRILESKVL